MAMEFGGDGLKTLNMSDRIAICNLCVEAGAKTALMEVDEITLDYLRSHGAPIVAGAEKRLVNMRPHTLLCIDNAVDKVRFCHDRLDR